MFDPTLPANGAPLVSAEMRAQLNGLKALIDAIGAITAAQIDSITTVGPGDPAAVDLSVAGNTLHFTFAIPRGNDGSQGPPGGDGNAGPQGPPFASAVVDAVNTLDPGTQATVDVAFDGTNVRFTFGIPRGANGSDGNSGTDGPQGPPGEVSASDLANAITGTSNNSNAVPTLDAPYGDPESEELRLRLNELIGALRR